MANTAYPLPRNLRETVILQGNGTAGPYGPTAFRVFDLVDLHVYAKPAGQLSFIDVSATVTKTKSSNQDFDFVSVTFPEPQPATTSIIIRSERLSMRDVAVSRAGSMDSAQLEKELSKQASVQQELRRDIDNSLRADFGFEWQEGDFPVIGPDGRIIAGGNAQDIRDAQEHAAAAATSAAQAHDERLAAEAARDLILTATPNAFPPTRSIMAALPAAFINAYLTEVGREGQFKLVDSATYASLISNDPLKGVIVPSTTDPTKAWLREYDTTVNVEWFGGVGVTDGQKIVAAANVSLDVELGRSKLYTLSNKWLVPVGRKIRLNGATIKSAVGFTDKQVLGCTGSIQIIGPGVIDGETLPSMTGAFIGSDLTGMTVLIAGNQTNPISDSTPIPAVLLDGVDIISGSCGGLGIYNAPYLRLTRCSVNGAYQHNTLTGAALFFLVGCHKAQIDTLKSTNRKWKGFSASSCNEFNATNISVYTADTIPGTVAGHAGVHVTGSNQFTMNSLIVIGGYGFKTDSCNYGVVEGLMVDCLSAGSGGVILQGGVGMRVSGTLRNFTGGGCSLTSDPTTGAGQDHICDLDMVRSSAAAGDGSSGYYFDPATANVTGMKLSGSIRRVARAFDFNTGSGLTINIQANNVRMYDIKHMLGYGSVNSFALKNCVVNDSADLVDGFRIWSGASGGALLIQNLNGANIGSSGSPIYLLTVNNAHGTQQWKSISLINNDLTGIGGLIALTLSSASMYVRGLSLKGNIGRDLQNTVAASLTSSSSTVTATDWIGNTLLASDGSTKRNLTINDATKFVGVASGNIATIPTSLGAL